jgi:hypothetical protein
MDDKKKIIFLALILFFILINFYQSIIREHISKYEFGKKSNQSIFINNCSKENQTKYLNFFDTEDNNYIFDLEANSDWFPEGITGNNITGYQTFIVPNIVHYVLLDYNQIDFVHFLSLKSVFKFQNPDKVMIHCNCDRLKGKYWDKLKNSTEEIQNKIIIRKIEKSGYIFGFKFSCVYHESDIVRNKVCIQRMDSEIVLIFRYRYLFII